MKYDARAMHKKHDCSTIIECDFARRCFPVCFAPNEWLEAREDFGRSHERHFSGTDEVVVV